MTLAQIKAIWGALRVGESLANPETVRTKGAIIAATTALLGSVASVGKAFGHDWSFLNDPQLDLALGVLVAMVFGVFTHAITSPDFGFIPRKPSDGPTGDGTAAGNAQAPAAVGGIDPDTRKAAEMWVRSQDFSNGATNDVRGGP